MHTSVGHDVCDSNKLIMMLCVFKYMILVTDAFLNGHMIFLYHPSKQDSL